MIKQGSRVTFHEDAETKFDGTVLDLVDVYEYDNKQYGTVTVQWDDGEVETFPVDELEEN
jgi:hypothetical protein